MITFFYKTKSARQAAINANDPTQYLSNFRLNTRPHSWRPPTDIYETEDQILILVEVAGIREENLTISIDSYTLTIVGSRFDPIEEKRAFHQMEIPFGEFRTEIDFPSMVDIEAVEAFYENGFLRINLPKAKPKKIELSKD